jgi:hypothetical protein
MNEYAQQQQPNGKRQGKAKRKNMMNDLLRKKNIHSYCQSSQ